MIKSVLVIHNLLRMRNGEKNLYGIILNRARYYCGIAEESYCFQKYEKRRKMLICKII